MSIIQVKVKPNSRERALEVLADGSYLATLTSPPVDGKANAELVALVARHFKVPRSAVAIKSGASTRIKRLSIDGPDLRKPTPA